MKIRFLQDTYIRSAPTREADPPLGTVFKGTVLEVDPSAQGGETVNNIAQWYRDKNGWFYWGGRTELVSPPAEPQATTIGGGILWPKPPEVVTPAEATGEIPPGETRPAPSLEQLLEWERQIRAGAPLSASGGEQPRALPTPPKPASSLAEEASGNREMPVSRSAAPPPIVPRESTLWKTANSRKINWGVENYHIARDWWQGKELTGRAVRIALLGTGVAPEHPDLADAIDVLYNFVAPNEPMRDLHGTGTQAAIIALGRGQIVFGVAPEARLLVGRIGTMDYNLTTTGLINGLHWAVDQRADIVLMLVDFPNLPHDQIEALQGAVQRAVEAGVFLIAPVGDAFSRKPETRYPAALDGVFTVGACATHGNRSDFSAKSSKIDLLAPGEGLLTSTPACQTVYNLKSTAMSAAFTAGFVSLVYQALRNQGREVWPGQVFDLLRQTAISRKPFNKGGDVECGYGLLNPGEVFKQINL
jgi:major intracellular serine protease